MEHETFKAHPAFQSIASLKEAFKNINTDALSNPLVQDAKAQFEYSAWCLERSTPSLISKSDMASINTHLNSALQEANSINANPNAHSQNVINNLGTIRTILPTPRKKIMLKGEAAETIQLAESSYAEALNRSNRELAELEEKISERETQLIALTSEIEAVQDQIKQLEAQYNSQLEIWSQKTDTAISKKDAEAQKVIADFQEKHSATLASAAKQLSSTVKKLGNEGAALTAKQADVISDTEKTLENWKKETETKGEKLLEDTRKIYEKTGSTAMSMDLIGAANSEHTWYRWTVGIALALFIAAPITVVIVVINFGVDITSLQDILRKTVFGLLFILPAWFMNSIAQKHRRAEIAFRSLGLRVAAIEPYLALFQPTERNEVKKKLADSFFTAPISHEKQSHSKVEPLEKQIDSIIGPLERIMDFAKRRSTGER